MKLPSIKSQALSKLVRSPGFLAALDNNVLRAIAQSHEHYVVPSDLTMTDFRLVSDGFCFFIAGEASKGYITWQAGCDVYTNVSTDAFGAGFPTDHIRAIEAGRELVRIGETLNYIKSVIDITLGGDNRKGSGHDAERAYKAWSQIWIDMSRGQ